MAKKQELHICFDRIIPAEHKVKALEHAISVRDGNRPKLTPKVVKSLSGMPNPAMGLAILRGKMWYPGQTLRCKFLEGSAIQKKRVEAIAHEWEQFANLKLKFGSDANAELRIAFMPGQGSWSGVGTDCLVTEYFPKTDPTINFGWLADDTDQQEYERVVRHEFGHALGAIHEHQSPAASKLKWNVPAVYKAFSGPPNNWTKADIDHNVLNRYAAGTSNFTRFDMNSIMLYSFPASLFLSGPGTPWNTDFSARDKTFMLKNYPK
jgi:hypothetical protein